MQRAVFFREESVWKDAAAKNPAAWLTFNALGTIQSNEQRYDKAIEQFERALHIKWNYAPAWNNLGATYADLGDLARAEYHHLKAALNADADRKADVYRNLVEIYEALDQPEHAAFFRRKIREVRPDLEPLVALRSRPVHRE